MKWLKWLQFNTLGTWLTTVLRGEAVGRDEHGNRYYRSRARAASWRREKRWVVYAGEPEPTTVPPGWYGWLHRRFEKPPTEQALSQRRWEKERLPNATGTPAAHLPPGDVRRGGERPRTVGDYEAWRP